MALDASLGLDQFHFAARIDYLTLAGLKRTDLPILDGKHKWPKSAPGALTIQECSADDLHKLVELFPKALIGELEVCVDVRTAVPLSPEEQDEKLRAFKVNFVAMRLKPKFLDGTNSGFRGSYDPLSKRVYPFNRRVPKSKEQMLHGHRNDGGQVKCYYKQTDNRRDLQRLLHSIRTEVRLDQVALNKHGVLHLHDLIEFKFRKELMPYFTHVQGSHRRKVRCAKAKPILTLLHEKQEQIDDAYWKKVGVGAFLRGGMREAPNLVFKRDSALNGRIGRALTRLERSVAVKKFEPKAQPIRG